MAEREHMWWSHRASSSSSSASRDCDTCTLSELLLPTRPCPGGEVSTWRITNPHLKTLGSACNRNLFAQAAAGDAASIARYSKQLILLVMPGNRYERDHVTTAVLGYWLLVRTQKQQHVFGGSTYFVPVSGTRYMRMRADYY